MVRRIAAILPFFLYSFWTGPGFAQSYANGDWMHSEWGWGYMMFGGLMMVVFWGAIILLIVVLVRGFGGSLSGQSPRLSSRQTPLEILEQRFAKGEIDKNEFEERRKILKD